MIAAAGDIACNPLDAALQQRPRDGHRLPAEGDLRPPRRSRPHRRPAARRRAVLQRDAVGVPGRPTTRRGGGSSRSAARCRATTSTAPPAPRGYFDYFNGVGPSSGPAGDAQQGLLLATTSATWHLIALNSNCATVGGCGAGSAQEQWLRADLAANPTTCTLAYWHHPRFSGRPHGDATNMPAIWQALVRRRGRHRALRPRPRLRALRAAWTPTGKPIPDGIREFVVGTGGEDHHAVGTAQPNSEVRNFTTFGVLRLTLRSGGLRLALRARGRRDVHGLRHRHLHLR